MVDQQHRPWQRVEPPPLVNGAIGHVLATVDALRGLWEDAISTADAEDFLEARRRSLRRHAIETGIIERLYDVEWGVTEALVAEGLTLDAAAREGGVNEDALATIRSQFDALTFLAESAREQRDLSLHFVRELHVALCRQQVTYEARNSLGQVFQATLHHGEWKTQPNHVRRPDDTLLEYTPPEHVPAEMERLLAIHESIGDLHPLIRAAWLHHAFILIHPFEDGNGRVARALTLLVLLRSNYAPLVVDRFSRGDYLRALDRANEGDLDDLVRLFSRLEEVALRSELAQPRPTAAGTSAVEVARSYVERLRVRQETQSEEKSRGAQEFAGALQGRVDEYLRELGGAIHAQFVTLDPTAYQTVSSAAPPDERARWWRAQVYRAARQADFVVNLTEGVWWSYLKLVVVNWTLRFIVVVQKVGRGETGVLALTVFAEAVPPKVPDSVESPPLYVSLLEITDAETATFAFTEAIETRWEEVSELLDRTSAAAIAQFAAGLDQ